MKQTMLIFFLFSCLSAITQQKIFEEYDFSKDRFELFFIESRGYNSLFNAESNDEYFLLDTSSNFYTNDTELLALIKNEWIGIPVDYRYECGYDYRIILTKNDSVSLTMLINLECSELITEDLVYKIDPTMVTNIFPQLKRLEKKSYKFESIETGRKVWQKVSTEEPRILHITSKPNWIYTDGFTDFLYLDSLKKDVDVIEKQLIHEFSERYPQDIFKLMNFGSSSIDNELFTYTFRLYCNRNLYDKFELYETTKWSAFEEFDLVVYWKFE